MYYYIIIIIITKLTLWCYGEQTQTQNLSIYNIKELIIQIQKNTVSPNWMNTQLSEENKVPRTLSGARNKIEYKI